MSHNILRPMTQEEIHSWYARELTEAFLPEERKPLEDILALHRTGRYELLGLFDGENALLGYATIWQQPGGEGLVLLDYLGVTARLRNGGIGAQMCGMLARRYGAQGLILESETPVPGGAEEENAIRRRRIGFYERNGFATVYEMATCGLRWNAMLWGPAPERLDGVMAEHRALYGPERTDVKIPLGPDEKPELPYWMRKESGKP